MALESQLSQIQGQHLVITPQMQQALKLLHCGNIELNDLIEQELLENPVLEREDEAPLEESASAPSNTLEEVRPEASAHEEAQASVLEFESEGRLKSSISSSDHTDNGLERTVKQETDLRQSLEAQAHQLDLPQKSLTIVRYIIGNLDDDGYLTLSCEAIATDCGVSLEEVHAALREVQSLEPCGVGARDLAECLLLQLDKQGKRISFEGLIIEKHLERVRDGRFEEIAKIEKVDLSVVRDALKSLKTLNPFPGRLIDTELTRFVNPDVFVRKVGQEYVVLFNSSSSPKLHLNTDYQELLKEKQSLDREGRIYLKSKMRGAAWLVRSLAQREQTIRKVSMAIVKRQQQFFEHGPIVLRPLTMREIAQDVGMHESTISRAIAHKYMDTPRGTFEFKYFFIAGVRTQMGGVSTFAVKEQIKTLIKNEVAADPLSDERIVQLLKAAGMNIARRTVSKYREAIGFPPALLRKHSTQSQFDCAV